jgi:hypothetical protein
MEKTIDGHDECSKKIHNKRRENAKVVGKKKMSQEEFGR